MLGHSISDTGKHDGPAKQAYTTNNNRGHDYHNYSCRSRWSIVSSSVLGDPIMVKVVKVTRGREVIGEMCTWVCTSHYGIPEWSGMQIEVGDKLRIWDANGGPAWTGRVVGRDDGHDGEGGDGWHLLKAKDCNDIYYLIHPYHGLIAAIDGCCDYTPKQVTKMLDSGHLHINGLMPVGKGWGSIMPTCWL